MMGTEDMILKLRNLARKFRDDGYFPSMSFMAGFLLQVADRLEELSKAVGKNEGDGI